MTSKAAKRRARKSRQSDDIQGLAAIPRRPKKRGKARMTELNRIAKDVDESIHLLETRCRHAGKPITEEAMREAKAPWAGCEAGQAMAREVTNEEKRSQLWDAIQYIRRVYAAYDRAMCAPIRHAQSMRIMLPVDVMHADAASPAIDSRDDIERQADAERAYASVQKLVGRYGRYAASITVNCVVDNQRCENTTAMVLALENVSNALRGSKCA